MDDQGQDKGRPIRRAYKSNGEATMGKDYIKTGHVAQCV